ncbi:MAG: peptidoglycan recognition protein family protein, partial [Planctomycetota bacterium]
CAARRVPVVQTTPRTVWADADPIADRLTPHTPQYLTIHHAGVKDDGTVPGDEKMRRLLRFSLNDKTWGDVPYHFVIDRQGHVWEGRSVQFAPDTNTGYNVDGHIGICVNGELTSQPLHESQYRSLIDLLAKLSFELDIPDGRIAGHMDYSPGKTDCPGVLEHYIRDGTILGHVRAVRNGRSFSFEPRAYDADVLSWTAPQPDSSTNPTPQPFTTGC